MILTLHDKEIFIVDVDFNLKNKNIKNSKFKIHTVIKTPLTQAV